MSAAKTAPIAGLVVCVALAAAATGLAGLALVKDRLHFSPLLLVILIGMLIGSTVRLPAATEPGLSLAQRPILRWAVAGLGFRLSLTELRNVGGPGLVVVVISTAAALAFGWWLARRLGLDERLGLLLGVGGAICGASAIVAANSVVQAEKKDTAISLGIITLLGTIGIVLYPIAGHALGMSDRLFGLWDGASLHEMAQVVAAGHGISDDAAKFATVVKLARICLLAPTVFGLGWWLRRKHRHTGTAQVSVVPWFLVLFVLFSVVNSSGVLSAEWLDRLRTADLWLLCIGMAGVGLKTHFGEIRRAGVAPLVTGTAQWAFLALVSYGLARALCR